MPTADLFALERAARAASDMGHYNVARVLRATAASVANRALYAESLPKTDADLLAALDALMPALAQAQIDPDLHAALQAARSALAERGVVLYEDAAPLLVCRVCGEAIAGRAPGHCPTCGAGRLTFQSFPAIYYLEPEPLPDLFGQLAETPGWLDRLMEGLADEQAARALSGSEGEWSLIDAAGHLIGAQELLARRVRLFAEHEAPDLAAQAPAEVNDAEPLGARQSAEKFRRGRLGLLAQLRALAPAVWLRTGRHTEFGPVTLQQQVAYFAKHEQWHMAQMTRMRRALDAG